MNKSVQLNVTCINVTPEQDPTGTNTDRELDATCISSGSILLWDTITQVVSYCRDVLVQVMTCCGDTLMQVASCCNDVFVPAVSYINAEAILLCGYTNAGGVLL